MEKLNRGDKIYLDKEKTIESGVNIYLDCRDGIVECYEYRDESGYGSKTKLFLCRNTKHETISIIRQVWHSVVEKWIEEELVFDSDSFHFLVGLITSKEDVAGGKYSLVRDY